MASTTDRTAMTANHVLPAHDSVSKNQKTQPAVFCFPDLPDVLLEVVVLVEVAVSVVVSV